MLFVDLKKKNSLCYAQFYMNLLMFSCVPKFEIKKIKMASKILRRRKTERFIKKHGKCKHRFIIGKQNI